MASNREERFLMRQRGAGTRQLRDSGFALEIPDSASTPAQRLSRSTPQGSRIQSAARTTPHTNSKRTPGSNSVRRRNFSGGSKPAPGRSSLSNAEGSVRKSGLATPVQTIAEETVAEETEEEDEPAEAIEVDNRESELPAAEEGSDGERENIVLSTKPVTSSPKKRKKRKSIGQQSSRKKRRSEVQQESRDGPDEDEAGDDMEAEEHDEPSKSTGAALQNLRRASAKVLIEPTYPRNAREEPRTDDNEDGITAPASKRRGRPPGKRVSEVRDSADLASKERPDTESQPVKRQGRSRKSITKPAVVDEDRGDGDEEGDNATRRSLKSGAKGKTRRQEVPDQPSEDETQSRPIPPVRKRKSEAAAGDVDQEANIADTERTTKRRRPRTSAATAASRDESDEATDQRATKSRRRPRESEVSAAGPSTAASIPRAAPPSKPRGRPRNSDVSVQNANTTSSRQRSASPDKQARSKKSSEAGIPVTVHRISRPRLLNFVDDDEDDLAGPAPLMKKAGVNAIDVLAQICREIATKFTESLKLNAQRESGSKRAEWKRKRKVVETFTEELEARLLQMTTTLDHNHGLNIRLKQVNKSKASLRDELMKLRSEREELAIQMDAIRIEHEKNTNDAKGANDLNTMMHDIELAVQRGRAAQQSTGTEDDSVEVGLVSRVQEAVENVSSADGRQGLLDKVKRFNAFLEKAVGVL